MCERKIQPRRKQQVVLLLSRRRIADVDVAERILPAQPLVDLCDQAQIERSAVFAGVAQIRICLLYTSDAADE